VVSQLQGDGIEVVTSPANGRIPHEQVYIDHRTRTAISAEALGSRYTAAGLANVLSPQKQQANRPRPQQQSPDSSGFNNNVPQLLSSLLHTSPDDEGPNKFGKDQSLGNRPKI
jgi:hypothetical protein